MLLQLIFNELIQPGKYNKIIPRFKLINTTFMYFKIVNMFEIIEALFDHLRNNIHTKIVIFQNTAFCFNLN